MCCFASVVTDHVCMSDYVTDSMTVSTNRNVCSCKCNVWTFYTVQPDLAAIRTYFIWWLIRMNLYEWPYLTPPLKLSSQKSYKIMNYSAYRFYEHVRFLGLNPWLHNHMIVHRHITQCSTNWATQNLNYVDRGANLVNAMGRISGKWQMTYLGVLAGGHVGPKQLALAQDQLITSSGPA